MSITVVLWVCVVCMCESSHIHTLSVSLLLLGCTPLCQHAKYIALMSHVWPCARPERRAARRGSRRARAKHSVDRRQLESSSDVAVSGRVR